jgi:hypothetical protein
MWLCTIINIIVVYHLLLLLEPSNVWRTESHVLYSFNIAVLPWNRPLRRDCRVAAYPATADGLVLILLSLVCGVQKRLKAFITFLLVSQPIFPTFRTFVT